ncbi:tetratricopeptide repeat protein [Morganella morganii]|uniref:tetratricopeptide repeat protein n=1 Tax=Morganella morganii TaxID=582 RepID=UPI002367DA41|nr:tetratricopeptide repeat protein [Morganella morganii]
MNRQNMKIFTGLFLYFIASESFANIDYDAMLLEIRSKPEYVLLLPEAQKGDPIAQQKIGDMYYEGNGAFAFPAQALFWYKKAGMQGNLTAQIQAGDFYYSGTGVHKNYFFAKKWYEKAANQGNVRAQISLGDLYSTGGSFFPKNKLKAKEWYGKACESGSVVGCNLKKSIQDK